MIDNISVFVGVCVSQASLPQNMHFVNMLILAKEFTVRKSGYNFQTT